MTPSKPNLPGQLELTRKSFAPSENQDFSVLRCTERKGANESVPSDGSESDAKDNEHTTANQTNPGKSTENVCGGSSKLVCGAKGQGRDDKDDDEDDRRGGNKRIPSDGPFDFYTAVSIIKQFLRLLLYVLNMLFAVRTDHIRQFLSNRCCLEYLRNRALQLLQEIFSRSPSSPPFSRVGLAHRFIKQAGRLLSSCGIGTGATSGCRGEPLPHRSRPPDLGRRIQSLDPATQRNGGQSNAQSRCYAVDLPQENYNLTPLTGGRRHLRSHLTRMESASNPRSLSPVPTSPQPSPSPSEEAMAPNERLLNFHHPTPCTEAHQGEAAAEDLRGECRHPVAANPPVQLGLRNNVSVMAQANMEQVEIPSSHEGLIVDMHPQRTFSVTQASSGNIQDVAILSSATRLSHADSSSQTSTPVSASNTRSSVGCISTPVSASNTRSSVACTSTPVSASNTRSSVECTSTPVSASNTRSSVGCTSTPVSASNTRSSVECTSTPVSASSTRSSVGRILCSASTRSSVGSNTIAGNAREYNPSNCGTHQPRASTSLRPSLSPSQVASNNQGDRGNVRRDDRAPSTVLNLEGAMYPIYQDTQSRRQSLAHWDSRHSPSVEDLIQSGMFYAGYADCVRCFFCGVGLKHWEATDDVWTEHARWRPTCEFLRHVKGDGFIRETQRKLAIENCNTLKTLNGNRNNSAPSGPKEKPTRSPPSTSTNTTSSPSASTTAQRESLASGGRASTTLSTTPCTTAFRQTERGAHRGYSVNDLPNESQAETHTPLCVKCRQLPIQIVLLPCGHFCLCQPCACSVWSCPLCQTTIRAAVSVTITDM